MGYISVREASEKYGYSGGHIRALLLSGKIAGKKFASVWMVDEQSIRAHAAWMKTLGRKKHGIRTG